MTRYSVEPRDGIFVTLSFAKSLDNNLSGKYSQKSLDHAKNSATGAVKTISKK